MRLYKNKDDALIAAFLKWDNALYLKRNVFHILTNRDIVKKYSLFCQNAEDKECNATRFVETISNLDLDEV